MLFAALVAAIVKSYIQVNHPDAAFAVYAKNILGDPLTVALVGYLW